MDTVIQSRSNPRCKLVRKLARRRARLQYGQTWVEGHREVLLALEFGWFVDYLLVREGGDLPADLVALVQTTGVQMYYVAESVWSELVYRDSTEVVGAVLDCTRRPESLQAFPVLQEAGSVVVLDAVEKPGNLGAIVRSADAAAVQAVVSCDGVDPFSPNAIRASLGAVFVLPVFEAGRSETVRWLRDAGYRVQAYVPDGTRVWKPGVATGKVALVFGSEAHGVSPAWLCEVDERIQLPMQGRVNSLNVAQCATVAMYDALVAHVR